MEKNCVLALLVLSSAFVFASPRGEQELVECGSWVYDSLTSIELESGITSFADSTPISIQEIKTYLNDIDREKLSAVGKAEYDRIYSYFSESNISFNSGIFSLGLEPSVNLEGYYKSNNDIDWIYDRYSRKPFLEAPAVFSAGDFITMRVGLKFSQNKGYMSHDDNYINIPFAADQMDVNFPSYGYISTGHKFTDECGINFHLGMGPQSVGRTLAGSVIQSEYFTGSTYANLGLYSNNLKYNMSVTQFNVDKYMYSHRVDVRLFKKLQFSVEEAMLVNAPIELRFLNPWTIYHGMSPWRDYEPASDDSESHTCAYMCFKASYVPVKYLRIYGLFAQDQFQTAYERENWPEDTTPNGIGFQLGAESYIPCNDGYFHAALEGYYADPYLYIKEDPNWSLVRTYSENIGDMAVFYEWVGSPFGPDTISCELKTGYTKPNKWSVEGAYLFMARGKMSGTNVFTNLVDWGGQDTTADDSNWVYPNSDNEGGQTEAKRKQSLVTPTGIPEYVNRISVLGTYKMLGYLTLSIQPGYSFYYNYNNIEGEFRHGAECAVSITFDLCELHLFNK